MLHPPEHVVILAGDHVCKMDYEQMLVKDANDGADVTKCSIEVPVSLPLRGA